MIRFSMVVINSAMGMFMVKLGVAIARDSGGPMPMRARLPYVVVEFMLAGFSFLMAVWWWTKE